MTTPLSPDQIDWPQQRALARRALAQFGVKRARLRLIKPADVLNIRVDTPDDRHFVLRMHPPERHPFDCLRSELWVLQQLAARSIVRVARPHQSVTGENVIVVNDAGQTRWCSLFDYLEHAATPQFDTRRARQMGTALAAFHEWSASAAFPAWFKRWPQQWIIDDSVKEFRRNAHRLALADRKLMRSAVARMREAYSALDATNRAAHGLIHADPNLSNWLFTKRGVAMIDFEVCSIGFYGFDLARVLFSLMASGATQRVVHAAYEAYAAIRSADAIDSPALTGFLLANLIDCVAFALVVPNFFSDPERAQLFARWLDVGRRLAR